MPSVQNPNPSPARDNRANRFSPLLMLRGSILTYAESHDDALRRVLSNGYSVMPNAIDRLVDIEKKYQDAYTAKYALRDRRTGLTAEAVVRRTPMRIRGRVFIPVLPPGWERLFPETADMYEVTIYNHKYQGH